MEKPGKRGLDVTILTFRGRVFNGILAALIRSEADRRLAVRYHDFSVSINNAGKKNAANKIYELLMKLQKRKADEGAESLKIPGQETWKFAGALPTSLLREMALADYYHYPEFLKEFEESELELVASSGSDL
jgi:hypothetical protein